ncbi:nicotinate-nucleotide--dimethylbenzimidazole phosphoribosyltransferase [Nakamurella endophytica]|uniref:Nicotinate-nucleotide--dimethylbenzimidazole phosphoribosyltransferase n=1 Tax=Nakamurella endophytica TaxID=1748367 RepID=A0A917SJ23_9ACTN|nr:nicotinate-nucleotide--dimethylbenzimidazole phosphoribosyltransferase [Nakamurella endophytica]GGL84926.1 nicotinate-nucleotide--dimethylbenzimidazole phosphoribosyltransferase [Nakamurella endophytica]
MPSDTPAIPDVPFVDLSTPARQELGVLGPLRTLLAACADGGDGVLRSPRLVVFAADHGVAELGVSAYPAAETAARVADLAAGRGPVVASAGAAGVATRLVDLTGSPSGRIDREDALTDRQLVDAVDAGIAAADREIDDGADLLVGGVCSVAVSTPAAALVAAVTGMEPVDVTSRGSGVGDAAWIRKVRVVRDALHRATSEATDAVGLLRIAGGADLAAFAGFVAQAAARRTPVLVDDVVGTLGAVLANRMAPGSELYVVATSLAPERAHRRLLDVLGRDPLTSWQLGLGSGLGAVLLVPAIRAAMAAEAATEALAADPGRGRTADAVERWDPELL